MVSLLADEAEFYLHIIDTQKGASTPDTEHVSIENVAGKWATARCNPGPHAVTSCPSSTGTANGLPVVKQ